MIDLCSLGGILCKDEANVNTLQGTSGFTNDRPCFYRVITVSQPGFSGGSPDELNQILGKS